MIAMSIFLEVMANIVSGVIVAMIVDHMCH